MSSAPPATSLPLAPASCGLCGGDEAEPVAVGEDFRRRSGRDAFLAVRCIACGLVYLTPSPPTSTSGALPPDAASGPLGRPARRAVRQVFARWARRLPPNATVLLLAPPPIPPVAELLGRHAPRIIDAPLATALADGAALIGSLERVPNPAAELRRVAALCRPGGPILVIAANPASWAARVFAGRHWSGYDFPRARALADPPTLADAASRAGLTVERVWTVGDSAAWTTSAGYLADDWHARPVLGRWLGRPSAVAAALARTVEALAGLAVRGGLVVATLRVPPGSHQ